MQQWWLNNVVFKELSGLNVINHIFKLAYREN